MRSYDEAQYALLFNLSALLPVLVRRLMLLRQWWSLLDDLTQLDHVRAAVKPNARGESPLTEGLRSVCWKTFLLFGSPEQSEWLTKLRNSRDAYASLRAHALRRIDNPDEMDDPLSENFDVSKMSSASA